MRRHRRGRAFGGSGPGGRQNCGQGCGQGSGVRAGRPGEERDPMTGSGPGPSPGDASAGGPWTYPGTSTGSEPGGPGHSGAYGATGWNPQPPRGSQPAPGPHPGQGPQRPQGPLSAPGPLPAQEPQGLSGPGRAERRRAAKGRGRQRSRSAPPPAAPSRDRTAPSRDPGAPGRPLTRVEARRAAKAAKDSPAVIASRALGELFITFGVLMLLFVTYQLWWTNVRAGQEVDRETDKIQEAWAKGREPGTFEPGQGFAIMHIPKLDVVVPVAASIDKEKVLDRGMVGHYSEGKLKTALPSDKPGNFAVAGHRNTHGEPFRYINRLKPGDPIVVETHNAYYTYEMASILPQTSPSNVQVIGPVPPGSGFTGPGRYITLTTCTPEFTSTYRMIVWGKMVEERPRSKGRPDALVG
ncbi:class E sortase [Streptomyces katsurahamanus]|uniref:class E sortase n=1 Tax=Streptomyces katsurahamanus TaxID=2577098 RepID=UPI00389AE9B4